MVILPVIYNMHSFNIKVSQKLQQVQPQGGDGKNEYGSGWKARVSGGNINSNDGVTNTSRPEP